MPKCYKKKSDSVMGVCRFSQIFVVLISYENSTNSQVHYEEKGCVLRHYVFFCSYLIKIVFWEITEDIAILEFYS